MTHIFVSYVREDTVIVERICQELRNRGMEVWLDRDSIKPGQRWRDAIRTAISEGSYFMACFSKAYASKDSTYMNEELTLAIDELRLRSINKRWFIPVLLSECEVPARSIGGGETLLDFQWVNIYTDFTSGLMRIISEFGADEIARRRDLIDEFGYMYTRKSSYRGYDNHTENARYAYLQAVNSLRTEYGITYDPIKLEN